MDHRLSGASSTDKHMRSGLSSQNPKQAPHSSPVSIELNQYCRRLRAYDVNGLVMDSTMSNGIANSQQNSPATSSAWVSAAMRNGRDQRRPGVLGQCVLRDVFNAEHQDDVEHAWTAATGWAACGRRGCARSTTMRENATEINAPTQT